MLYLKDISLTQFKNYKQASFQFRERIVGLYGLNGVGKTNLLDAIYYLCWTRGYFSKSDQQYVHQDSAGFRIEGRFEKEDALIQLTCVLRETGKKEFTIDGSPYERLSLHVGRFPCVMVAPDDVQIISGGGEERRRYLDALLSQMDADYLQRLIEYNRVLQQRNGFLRSLRDGRLPDTALLDVYDAQLATYGDILFSKRRSFLHDLIPLIAACYTLIAGGKEPLDLEYKSQLLQQSLGDILRSHRDRDILVQRTGGGIHKDDIDIRYGGQPFRSMASQGQRKSLLFAFKLAAYEMLKQAKGFAPILLLDDVFEKLDALRMRNLLDKVCLRDQGQIFITDTHKDRIHDEFHKLGMACQLIGL